jgi:CRP-like cAMP-binding protein
VLDGILIRRVALAGRCAAELLGEGDLLSLSEGEEIESRTLPVACGCSALKPARLAVLGPGFMLRARRYPELATALVERMTRRSHNLAVNMAIVHQPRIDVRLRLLLWHLAERWGRVRSDGTWLPLRLTHSVLGELVAARRPTVSKALMDLAKAGVLRQLRDGWVLYGEPPVAVHDPTLLHTEHVFR